MNVTETIKKSGFNLAIDDQLRLVVTPSSKLTDTQRSYIKTHKDAIIAELRAKPIQAKYQRFTVIDRTGKVYDSVTGESMTVEEYRGHWPEFVIVEGAA